MLQAIESERLGRCSTQNIFGTERALHCCRRWQARPGSTPYTPGFCPSKPKPRSPSGATFLHTGDANGTKSNRHHEPSRGTVPYNGAREFAYLHRTSTMTPRITHVPIRVRNVVSRMPRAIQCDEPRMTKVLRTRSLDSIHDSNAHAHSSLVFRPDDLSLNSRIHCTQVPSEPIFDKFS
jgi:hypothetical protein